MSQSRADTLRAHFSSPNGAPRPLLTSLNGDNSWLMSFPRPAAERARPGSKAYFHIVSDPWLTGYASAGASWVISIRTVTPAAIPSGAAVEAVISEIENTAAAASENLISAPRSINDPEPSPIDAIFLNFHYSDHLDEATLRTFHPEIPVFATAEAAAIVRRWGHFSHVTETRDLDPATAPGGTGAWRSLHPRGSLPDWLTVFRLRGHHELNFATAIIYSSSPSSSSVPSSSTSSRGGGGGGGGGEEDHETKHEALLYSPHGIKADQPALKAFVGYLDSAGDSDGGKVSVLVILHALKDSFAFGMATTLGVAGGLALERLTRPRYWVKSHDAPLGYAGIVAWVAWVNDVARTLRSGLDEEKEEVNGGEDRGERKEPNVVEVENGGCFVLE